MTLRFFVPTDAGFTISPFIAKIADSFMSDTL